MSLFRDIDDILNSAKVEFEELKTQLESEKAATPAGPFFDYDIEKYGSGNKLENTFFWGDNLEFMKLLLAGGLSGKVQLVYIDPPFFSKAKYEAYVGYKGHIVKNEAYTDSFSGGIAQYIKMFAIRLYFIYELLADKGALWLHLDWHAAHYMKIVMDEIFGAENFVNEVVWAYKSGGSSKRSFAKKHDTLLFYSKTKEYYFDLPKEKSYNRGLSPYRFKNVKEYQDETGWYTLVNMKDVWNIDMLGRTSKERTGYMTQKPETLMMRIIESCSKSGDLCIDFFSGSGSFASACQQLDRSWLASDFGSVASSIMRKRCIDNLKDFNIVYKSNKKIRNILNISIERFEKEYIIKLEGIPDSNKDIDVWGIYEKRAANDYHMKIVKKRSGAGQIENRIAVEQADIEKNKKYAVLAVDIFGNIYEERLYIGGDDI